VPQSMEAGNPLISGTIHYTVPAWWDGVTRHEDPWVAGEIIKFTLSGLVLPESSKMEEPLRPTSARYRN